MDYGTSLTQNPLRGSATRPLLCPLCCPSFQRKKRENSTFCLISPLNGENSNFASFTSLLLSILPHFSSQRGKLSSSYTTSVPKSLIDRNTVTQNYSKSLTSSSGLAGPDITPPTHLTCGFIGRGKSTTKSELKIHI